MQLEPPNCCSFLLASTSDAIEHLPHRQQNNNHNNHKMTTRAKALLCFVLLLVVVITTTISVTSAQDDSQLEEELRIDDNNHRTAGDLWPSAPMTRARKRENELLDPFSFTFEDYLREASGSQSVATSGNQQEENKIQTPLQIENDEDTKQEAATNEVSTYNNNKYQHPDSSDNDEQQQQQPVKLLFAWRALPTNKCSRNCGRGVRVNHLSCLDLKFNVRVEDELCSRAGLAKPAELSDEPCNELDCEPQWQAVEFQQCNTVVDDDDNCKTKTFKRLECTQVNRHGQTVHLDESQCQSSQRPGADSDTTTDELDLNEQLDKLRNRILLTNEDAATEPLEPMPRHQQQHKFTTSGHKKRPQNEPFWDVGEWSECQSTSTKVCGQLGTRTRQVACRLYLARSAKYVELPESTCQSSSSSSAHHQQPDRQEPCYLDCGPAASQLPDDVELTIESARESPKYQLHDQDDQDDQEEIQMARFRWRHATDWTRCTADCLGGTSESLVECWDQVVNSSVELAHCENSTTTTGSKPHPLRRTCNESPCAPQWRAGPYSECTRACGSAGERTRSVVCVQQVAAGEERTSFVQVSSEACNQKPPPHTTEPCNRHDCRPEWSLGPWSECTGECTNGRRNRTVICLQEFATQWWNPWNNTTTNVTSELREALQLATADWAPGKSVQVPSSECFRVYHSAPQVSEPCRPNECDSLGERLIDADPMQDYRTILPDGTPLAQNVRRRTISLKVGGRAQVLEGRTLKIRCRVLVRQHEGNKLVRLDRVTSGGTGPGVEWRKDGVRIFAPNSSQAELVTGSATTSSPDHNSIWGDDVLENELLLDKYSLMAADEPRAGSDATTTTTTVKPARKHKVRSWTSDGGGGGGGETPLPNAGEGFQFVVRAGGRFSLVKENTLRIKRLRPDDSGVYTCTAPATSTSRLSESLELQVLSKHSQRRRHRRLD